MNPVEFIVSGYVESFFGEHVNASVACVEIWDEFVVHVFFGLHVGYWTLARFRVCGDFDFVS